MQTRSILITGAGSGVGAAMAAQLAAAGHSIHVTDLDGRAAARVADGIVAAGGIASAAALDVTRADDVARVIDAAGRVDVLVNNAGLQHVSPLADFPPEKWQLLVNVMLVGPALTTRAVLPGMRARGFGRIVNVGSIHSLVASAYKSAYVAAKHGLIGLAKTVALETGDVDVTINTICPAYLRTPLVEKQIADQARTHGIPEQQVVEQIMLKPMPKKAFVAVEEVTALVQYLISDAARNVTAQAIAIDGGWTAT
ncbi:MAG: 3-hydroxybutyrate dehydrogenase [Steroidobacteraceae bacterium]|jgi:3-hydroxybutyrate dehydrogenase|nr:3-hydroxybutyrate dehydrogenase [Steroidobacteraceae bacterium]